MKRLFRWAFLLATSLSALLALFCYVAARSADWINMYPADYAEALASVYWRLLPFFLILPAYAAIKSAVVLKAGFTERRRRGACLCAWCGYDLRATRDRCPECGAVPPGKGAT